jgi:predicted nucleotidyltransferase component of viral defense system
MSVRILQDRLSGYACGSSLEEEHALREMTQELVLAGLSRSDFFGRASFQGGTCLRIFHGVDRFSEDLDFALLAPDTGFSLVPYLEKIRVELAAYGYEIEVEDRPRAGDALRKAFVKDDSIGKLLNLKYRPSLGPPRKLRVKLEVDANPPSGARHVMPMLDFPFPASVRTFDLPSLFAGKVHALLCRGYLKGRDWYDFIWYSRRRTAINHGLLSSALDQQGPWRGMQPACDDAWCVAQLERVIHGIDWRLAREDVRRFLKPHEVPSLDLWTKEFFLQQCRKLGTQRGKTSLEAVS